MAFNLRKVLVAAIVLPVVLTGCGDKSTTTDAVEIDRPQMAFKIHPIETKKSFLGALDDAVSGYTIDVRLKSNTANTSDEFNQYSPPMPFMTNAFGLYQLDGQYSVYLNANKKSLLGGAPLDWTRLTIANDGQMTRLYINGEMKAEQPDQTALSGQIALGKGISQRYWGGQIKHFDIYEGSNTPAEIDGSSAEMTEKVLMNLDSLLK